MPSSKARNLADLLGGGGAGVPSFSGTGAIDVPAGTTAERPSNPNSGYVRFNTDLDQLEQYTVENGWQGIAPPPTITSTDVDNLDETATTQTVVITGQNFDLGATANLIDANGSVRTPTTSVRNSNSQITITYSGGDVLDATVPEPLAIKVTNASGLLAELSGAISIDARPIWNTSNASELATLDVGVSMSPLNVVATEPDGGSVSYSVTGGALPSGLVLSNNGVITGTPSTATYANGSPLVTHNFTVTADDLTGNTTNRTFSIIRKWNDGSSSSTAAVSAQSIRDLGVTSDGTFWIQPTGCPSPFQVHCFNSIESGGWELAYRFGTTTNNTSPDASGSWGVANWSGWGAYNQSVVDGLSGNNNYAVRADNDAMSPVFAYTPFTDFMVISNRTNYTSKRTGHRMGSTMSSLHAVTGGTSSQNYTENVLFGSLQWLQVLDIKSDIASVDAWGGATRVGFKIRSDSGGSTTSTGNFTGSFWTSTMHYGAQIGFGRESSSDSGKFGGGFGGNYSNSSFFKGHGHWWGHGMQWTGSSSYDGNVFYGHSVYVRRS